MGLVGMIYVKFIEMGRFWTWITFNIPLMWEFDNYLTKKMLKRLKRKYIKNQNKYDKKNT